MKKTLIILFLFLGSIISASAEIKRIVSGNLNAKITIIAYESLTCSHCADFHKNVYPQLKKNYLDTGLAKIEFRHFPLDVAAFNASKIAQCKQDQSLEILKSLYSNQQERIAYLLISLTNGEGWLIESKSNFFGIEKNIFLGNKNKIINSESVSISGQINQDIISIEWIIQRVN